MTALLFVAGLVLLVAGGELLVRGAAKLAAATGIRPLVIGLTVVAFGTSSPELAVSIQAALAGQVDIAVGNVVGSNIFNILLILGLSAAVVPLVVSTQLVRIDVPIMIGASFLLLLLAGDGMIGRWESAWLVIGIVLYIIVQILLSRRVSTVVDVDESLVVPGSTPVNIVLIVLGLALLVLGSRWLVQAAVSIAQLFGVTQLVIGLTIVAAGTSMPELATSVIAGVRGQRDIAVGNIVGSNIFNILAVLGLTGVIAPGGLPVSTAALTMDLPVMIAVAVLCLPIFFAGYVIGRVEGIVFVLYYALYTTFLVLTSSHNEELADFRAIVFAFVLPVTLATLLVFNVQAWRRSRASRAPAS